MGSGAFFLAPAGAWTGAALPAGRAAFFSAGAWTTKTCSQALQRTFLPTASDATLIFLPHSGQAIVIASAIATS